MGKLYDSLFRRPPPNIAQAEERGLFRDWCERPYYTKYIAYLEEEIQRPVPVDNPDVAYVAAIRSNTFKEVRHHLRRLEAAARRS